MGLPGSGALAATAACALAICACGESPSDTPAPRRSARPHALAEGLAARGETVASRLDSGDLCGAAIEADRLRAEAEAAQSSVPAELRAPLTAAVRRLDAQVECPPQPPPTEGRAKGREEALKKREEALKKREEARKKREEARKKHEEEDD
jgi:hypothetical protein